MWPWTLGLFVAWAHASPSATDPAPLRLDWVAPPQCPGAEAVVADVGA